MAERLVVTEHTIEKHVKNIFGTLRLPQSPDDHSRVPSVPHPPESESINNGWRSSCSSSEAGGRPFRWWASITDGAEALG
ncbi:MAG: hypothetical protein ACLP0J_00320 [Solirubrobacteraceae bacterium]